MEIKFAVFGSDAPLQELKCGKLMIVARSKLKYLRFTGSALSSDSLTLTMREVWTMMGLF